MPKEWYYNKNNIISWFDLNKIMKDKYESMFYRIHCTSAINYRNFYHNRTKNSDFSFQTRTESEKINIYYKKFIFIYHWTTEVKDRSKW